MKSRIRKILAVLLVIVFAVLFAMAVYPPARDFIFARIQEGATWTANVASGFMAAVSSTPAWATFIQPYLFGYGIIFGIIVSVIVAKLLWPKVPSLVHKTAATTRDLQDKLTPSPPAAIPSQTKTPTAVAEPTVEEVEENE